MAMVARSVTLAAGMTSPVVIFSFTPAPSAKTPLSLVLQVNTSGNQVIAVGDSTLSFTASAGSYFSGYSNGILMSGGAPNAAWPDAVSNITLNPFSGTLYALNAAPRGSATLCYIALDGQ